MKEDNIPYEQLRLIGITESMLNEMPKDFKDTLASGDMTPMISAGKIASNGKLVEMPVRLQLKKDESGKTALVVYPVHYDFENDLNLSHSSFIALKDGAVLKIDNEYIQRDPQTNCILKVSEKELDLEKKLKDIEKVADIELGTVQKEQIRNGKPVELNSGGETVTLGIDLKEPNHIKSLNGDLKDWEYNQKVMYDILHPEFVGYVKTDENRWEYQQILMSDKYPEELRHKPKQTVSAGIKR